MIIGSRKRGGSSSAKLPCLQASSPVIVPSMLQRLVSSIAADGKDHSRAQEPLWATKLSVAVADGCVEAGEIWSQPSDLQT